MQIHLGKHLTYEGREVDAWLEPSRPALLGGAVRDHCFLCIQEHGQLGGAAPLSMRLEPMSGDAARLTDAVGSELARTLWAERRKYDAAPFYRVHDHAQFGRLYFEPWTVEGGDPSVSFRTRPDSRYPAESAVIRDEHAPGRLEALFVHEHIQRQAPMMPDAHALADALDYAHRMTAEILEARATFEQTVDWDFDTRLTSVLLASTGRAPLTQPEDIARYELLSSWALRPDITECEPNSPELIRWYQGDGEARLEPLTVEQLAAELQEQINYPEHSARDQAARWGVTTEDWDWLKNVRLGRLREPIEALQYVIRCEERNPTKSAEWLRKARQAADFCGTVTALPVKVQEVLAAFVQRHAHTSPGEHTFTRQIELANDPALRVASAALKYLEDPQQGFALDRSHPATQLMAKYEHAQNSAEALGAARMAGDREAVELRSGELEAIDSDIHRLEVELDRRAEASLDDAAP